MAKKRSEKVTESIEALRPYVERALKDENVRKNVRQALVAAQDIYGDLSKGNGKVARSASKLASDKDVQENVRKAFAQLSEASERVKGKKKSNKGRNAMLAAGIIVGLLYNPWTGPQTRQWVMDKIAGEDDLQPLESWESSASDTIESVGGTISDATDDAVEAVASTAKKAKD
jgi:hypothetical protein